MLKVNEIFGPTIQGEGKSSGLKVLFLRLAQCNLHCIWCDTPYTWNWKDKNFSHPDKYDYDAEVHQMSDDEVIAKIEQIEVKAIVLSGGEPFLQQKQLVPVLQVLKNKEYWIEVETNGTILPRPEFLKLVDQINCSPKLSNSGDLKKLRERTRALVDLVETNKANFKFVIASENDALEAISLVKKYGMREVYFMPEGRTRDELAKHIELVREYASKYRVIFTNRLHIIEFGGIRGV